MTDKDEKKAIYGAIQRLLMKVSEKYPYTSDFGFEIGHCPEHFDLVLGLSHGMMNFSADYTGFNPELGDLLFQDIINEDN